MFQRIKCLLERHDWRPITDDKSQDNMWACAGCGDRQERDPHALDGWRAHSGGSSSISGGAGGLGV